jgi:hypothetical protein
MGTASEAVPVAALTEKFSSIRRIAAPPFAHCGRGADEVVLAGGLLLLGLALSEAEVTSPVDTHPPSPGSMTCRSSPGATPL